MEFVLLDLLAGCENFLFFLALAVGCGCGDFC